MAQQDDWYGLRQCPVGGNDKGIWVQFIGLKESIASMFFTQGVETAGAKNMLGKNSDTPNLTTEEKEKIGKNHKVVGSISLAVTSGLSDSQGVGWGVSKDGLLGIMSSLGGLTGGDGDTNTKTNNTGKSNTSAAAGAKKDFFTKYLGNATKVAQNIAGMFGTVVPPFFNITYDGTSPRTFDYDFQLIPQSSDEAMNIQKIIATLKAWMLPGGLDKDGVFNQPYVIQTNIFSNGKMDILNKLINPKLSVITNVQVSYGSEPIVYRDGMPKVVNLRISLQECLPQLRQDYEDFAKDSSSAELGRIELGNKVKLQTSEADISFSNLAGKITGGYIGG